METLTPGQVLACTWVVIAALALVSWLATRRLDVDQPSRLQSAMEAVVAVQRSQVREVMDRDPDPFLPFLGGLFLFISTSSILALVPGFHPPTAALPTTAALAACVFVAVPIFGVLDQGLRGYLGHYLRPNLLMLPFHVLGELTRTVSLAVRLFGNAMSGTVLVGLALALAPLLFPLVFQAFELLIGQVQAYIFAVLATVYMASAARARGGEPT